MKKNLIVIRHSGDSERLKFAERKLFESSVDFCIIQEKYHENFHKDTKVENFVYLSEDFLRKNNLKKLKIKTGWVCGDYIFYAAKYYFPGYDYYWVVDDDLLLNVDIDRFIDKSNSIDVDLLANAFGKSSEKWYWRARLDDRFPGAVYAMFFGIVRLTARAVDFLHAERSSYLSAEDENFPNDESFVASYLMNNGYACENMRSRFGELFPFFSLNNPVLYEELDKNSFYNKIIHPLCSRKRAREKLKGSQLSNNEKIDTLFRWYVNFGQFFVENNFDSGACRKFEEITKNRFFEKIPSLYESYYHHALVRKWFYSPRLLVLEFSEQGLNFALDVHWDGRINFIARNNAAQGYLIEHLHEDFQLLHGGQLCERLAAFSKYFDISSGGSSFERTVSFVVDYLLSLRRQKVPAVPRLQ